MKNFQRSSVSPTNQDLSNDTTFSQIKSRVPVPLTTQEKSQFFAESINSSDNHHLQIFETDVFLKRKKVIFLNIIFDMRRP